MNKVKSISNNWIEEKQTVQESSTVIYTVGSKGVTEIQEAEYHDTFDVHFENGEVVKMHDVKYVRYFPKEIESETSKQERLNRNKELSERLDKMNKANEEESNARQLKRLRDDFAKSAIQGFLSDGFYNIDSIDNLSVLSYSVADAMLKARENV
jgi:hypothetical protein